MIVRRLTHAPYELPFKTPLHTARGVLTVRRGFIFALHTDQGIAIGEVAPLPEFGTETLKGAEDALRSQDALILDVSERLPATRFGIEAAIGALEQRSHRDALLPDIRVNALLAGSTMDEIWNSAQYAVRAGYRTLKVKVGTRSIRNDIEIIRVLRATFPNIGLRADANGAWTFDEARQFAHGVTACDIEFLEDPLRDADSEALAVFRRNCDVPLACDEMAQNVAQLEEIISRHLCDVLVLKPSVIGSYKTLRELSETATSAGIGVVITSLLESSIGLSYVAHIAAQFGTPELAHGLGTAELFERDTLTHPLLQSGGKLTIPDIAMLRQLLNPEIASQLDMVD